MSTSLSNNAATDGKDIGVNFTELNAALRRVGAPPRRRRPLRTPFSGTPIALPGTIEAENYDKGGEGVAYHDTTAGQQRRRVPEQRRGYPEDDRRERRL